MKANTETRAQDTATAQFVVFMLGDEEFGAEIGQVREIVKTGPVTPIPDSPNFIKGVTNVRGEIVVVIDLKTRFSIGSTDEGESKHIMITKGEKRGIGLMVDEVSEVLRISEAEVQAPPDLLTTIHERYLRGVVTVGKRLIMLLDLSKVLSGDDLARLAEIQRKHRESGEQQTPEDADEPPGAEMAKPQEATV